MNNVNRPHHRLDTSTGWNVFSYAPNTETVYDNYRFKWSVIEAEQSGWFSRTKIHFSMDDGHTWNEENTIWSMHNVFRNQLGYYHDNNSPLNQALLSSREAWKVARRRELDRKRREELKALPPEQRALVLAERSAVWRRRKEKSDERKAQRIARIMDQFLHFGPELVRLKEDIDGLLTVMAKGGMDRPLAYYDSRRRWINGAKWYINGYRRDIEEAQKRAADKKNAR